ncbi:pyruvate kinase alpha/beta domain-containing protein, partial [Haloarcula salina]
TDALARSGRFLARDIGASAVVAASESGYTALKSAKYRPSIPIVASTPSERVRRRLALSWGITPVTTSYTTEGADAIIQTAVQAALDTEAADSGDTVVVLSGMMTELEGMNTANMLKVHVAAETIASGRSIVDGLVTGPIHRLSASADREAGDLSTVPDGAIVVVPDGFDGEFVGDASRIGGIIDAHEGVTSYAAIVARELSIPMISNAALPDGTSTGSTVTLDAERGVVYEEAVGREDISAADREH